PLPGGRPGAPRRLGRRDPHRNPERRRGRGGHRELRLCRPEAPPPEVCADRRGVDSAQAVPSATESGRCVQSGKSWPGRPAGPPGSPRPWTVHPEGPRRMVHEGHMSDVKITLTEVEHVARLARLALGTDEKERMRNQLDAILGYVEQLQRVDTTGVEPTAHVLPLVNVMRED